MDGLNGLYDLKSQHVTMKSTEQIIQGVRNTIRALQSATGKKTLLVIDQMDLLLAMSGDGLGPVQLGDMLLDVREVFITNIVTLEKGIY